MLKAATLIALVCLLAACGGPVSPSTPGDPTWQWAQYDRDAQATLDAEAITRQAISRALYATDAAATDQAGFQLATQSAQATNDENQRQADATETAIAYAQATATAYAQATSTAIAQVQETETAAAHRTETAVSNVLATEARAVEATTTAVALEAQITKINNERLANTIGWALTFAAILGALGLLAWLGIVGIQAWRKRTSLIKHGPHGDPILILDGPHGQQVVLDPQRMFGGATVIQDDGTVTAPVLAKDEYQDRTTARAQLLALEQVRHFPGRSTKLGLGPLVFENTSSTPRQPQSSIRGAPVTPALPESPLPSDAPWQVLDTWRGGALPIGMNHTGLLLADPETTPHFLMAGTSGSGKTRFGLRPLITAALADGWQAIIIDRSGLDFLPFRDHPNAIIRLVNNPLDAIHCLAGLYGEIERRLATLRDAGVSTWGRLPSSGPRLLAVLDEFSNLADSLPDRDREELWRQARMIAAEGRKAGVHLALALQDPTHKSLDLRIRRNCTPLAFRVKDGEASRVILGSGGAETLAPRQFMAVMGSLMRGVAFAPDDEQITSFLSARNTPALGPPDWLTAQPPLSEGLKGEDPVARVLALHSQNLGVTQIQRRVFGTGPGGRDYYRVKSIISGSLLPENMPESLSV